MLTILAILVVLLCLGIATISTNRALLLERKNKSLSSQRHVVSSKLDVLGDMLAPRTGTRAEAKLILARNYLKGLRAYIGV